MSVICKLKKEEHSLTEKRGDGDKINKDNVPIFLIIGKLLFLTSLICQSSLCPTPLRGSTLWGVKERISLICYAGHRVSIICLGAENTCFRHTRRKIELY